MKRNARRVARGVMEMLEERSYLSGVTLGSATNQAAVLSVVPGTAIVEDFNGDGRQDLVLGGTEFGVGVLGVYVSDGVGSFHTPTILPLNGTPAALGVGSFDSTGHHDVVVATAGSPSNVDVYLNDGSANFTLGAGGTGLANPVAIAVGDFTNNGDNDVLEVSGSQAMLLEGNGSGGLTAQAAFSLPFGSVSAVTVGDFNGDGNLDFAVANQGNNSVSVLLGNGNGTFGSPTTFGVGPSPSSIAVANFGNQTLSNGKPMLDIVTADSTGGEVSYLQNNGSGGFNAAVNSTVSGSASGGGPTQVLAANLNGTGEPLGVVVLMSSGSSSDAEALVNNGSGSFSLGTTISVGGSANGIAAGDINGDGLSDVVVTTSSQVSALVNQTTPGSPTTPGVSPIAPVILHSTLPTAVVAGSAAARGVVSVKVTNTAATSETENVTVGLYASMSGTVDANSILLGSITRRISLKTGASAAIAVPIKSLPTTLDGSYTVFSQVTDASGNTAASSTGVGLTASAPVIGFSEMLVRTTLLPSDVSGEKTGAVAQLRISNGGNIASTGETAIGLYVSLDTNAADGTLVRSVREPVVIRPGASRVVTVPLLSLPSVASGAYHLVAAVTDSQGNATSVASASTFELAPPVSDWVPTFVSYQTIGLAATPIGAIATISIANDGNVVEPGVSTITVTASSADGGAGQSLTVTEKVRLVVAPGRSELVRVRLTRAQAVEAENWTVREVMVVDPLGNSQSAFES